MKKLSILFASILFAATFVFVGCTPDESDIPTVTFTKTGTVAPGNVITYTVNCESKNELKTFTVNPSTGTGAVTLMSPSDALDNPANVSTGADFKNNLTYATITYAYTIPANASGTTIKLNFAVTDKNADNNIRDSFVVAPATISLNNVTLTCTTTSLSATNGLKTNPSIVAVALNGSDASVMDLVFAYNGTAGIKNTICSPDAAWIVTVYSANNLTYSTSGKRNTKVQKLSGYTWPLTDAQVNALTVTSSTISGGGNGVNALAVGDIIAFQTSDGRKGVLKVTTLPTAKANLDVNATITGTFDVLVQQASSSI